MTSIFLDYTHFFDYKIPDIGQDPIIQVEAGNFAYLKIKNINPYKLEITKITFNGVNYNTLNLEGYFHFYNLNINDFRKKSLYPHHILSNNESILLESKDHLSKEETNNFIKFMKNLKIKVCYKSILTKEKCIIKFPEIINK